MLTVNGDYLTVVLYVCVIKMMRTVNVINAGTPQGTRAGPNNFKLLINDLHFDLPYIKYVDDTTVASISHDPNNNSLQGAVDCLADWCNKNGMHVNASKTKEMIVHFGRSNHNIPPLQIYTSSIERVVTFKLLGVIFSSDLTWSAHILHILSKTEKRLYVIYQLVY